MKAMSIKELCEMLRIDDSAVVTNITSAGIASSDDLLQIAPNAAELLQNFDILDEVHRRKLVTWQLTVASPPYASRSGP